MKSKNSERLREWQDTVSADESAYSGAVLRMEERERIYQGRREIDAVTAGDEITETPHVRNIISELIECQVSSDIPHPKVTALRRSDDELSELVEDMLRNKLDKLPFHEISDLNARTVPVQGGGFVHYEWDNTRRTHTTIGEGALFYRHPKSIIPQDGVTSSIENMDHITLKIPQTADYIKRRYKVDVSKLGEDDASLRSPDGGSSPADNMVTQYIVYYRNDSGGIGKFSYVQDTVLEDIEDYQARYLRRCSKCGTPEPAAEVTSVPPTPDGSFPISEEELDEIIIRSAPKRSDSCPHCGGRYKHTKETHHEILAPFFLPDGTPVEKGAKIPFYKPDIYPIFLQRNVSRYGEFLGESDVDKIACQQNSLNRLYAKWLDQLCNAGSYITLPNDVKIPKNSREGKVIRMGSNADSALISVKDLTANTAPVVEAIDYIYNEAQKIIGITDSFLGRKDTTATSGKAKEFSAAQAAGRLESKRIMKNDMYANLYEGIFKFELAYADEVRPVISQDLWGDLQDEEWNKWFFLKRDDAGEWYWNTDFLFSVDSTAPLASNREAMWQETRSHFESGAYGDPSQPDTQLEYWSIMSELHYPGAKKAKEFLKKKLEDMMVQQPAAPPAGAVNPGAGGLPVPAAEVLPLEQQLPEDMILTGGEML